MFDCRLIDHYNQFHMNYTFPQKKQGLPFVFFSGNTTLLTFAREIP